jgi:hypothetical protein
LPNRVISDNPATQANYYGGPSPGWLPVHILDKIGKTKLSHLCQSLWPANEKRSFSSPGPFPTSIYRSWTLDHVLHENAGPKFRLSVCMQCKKQLS